MLVVNCGSVGHPVDGDTRLSYAIIKADANSEARGRVILVKYNIQREMNALKGTSLPKGLRQDLKKGTKRMFLQ